MAIRTPPVRHAVLTLATLVSTLATASGSDAIVVRHPELSTVYVADFARAYRECLAPNTTNAVGIPACAPPVTSACTFAGGALRIRRRDRDTTALHLDATLANVGGPGSCPTGPHTLLLHLRVTADDPACAGGACTVTDLPVGISLLQLGNDFERADFILESAFPGPIPALAGYEIVSAVVMAPDGLPMAAAGVDPDGADVRGSFTAAYAECTAPDTTNAWGLAACSAPLWTSPCDFRFADMNMATAPPATRMRARAEDLVGAPPECANGTYTVAPRLRITTSDCGMPCTLVDFDHGYPVTVERGEITVNPSLAFNLPFALHAGDVLQLLGARLLDPFGNPLAALGTTPSLRLGRPRLLVSFRDAGNPTDDRITIKGRFPYPPLDPTVGGATFTLQDKDGLVYTATVPAGGWEVRTPGRKWRYQDELGTIAGVRKAEISETRSNGNPNGYKILVVAKDVDASAVDLPAADVSVAVSHPGGGIEVATSGTICQIRGRGARCK